MTTTTDLLKRLEAGNAWLSKEIDDLTRALFGTSYTFNDWGLVDDAVKGSIDAAVALVERVRPGWDWILQKTEDGCEARVQSPDYKVDIALGAHSRAPTPAAALVAALLKAKGAGDE